MPSDDHAVVIAVRFENADRAGETLSADMVVGCAVRARLLWLFAVRPTLCRRGESAANSSLKLGADSGRVMDDSGTVKRCFALEFARKLVFFHLEAGSAFRL